MNKKRLGPETQEHLEPQSDKVCGWGGYCTSPHSCRCRRLDNTGAHRWSTFKNLRKIVVSDQKQ